MLITILLIRRWEELFDLRRGATFEFPLPNREPAPADSAWSSRAEGFLGPGLTPDIRGSEEPPAEGSGLLWCGKGGGR